MLSQPRENAQTSRVRRVMQKRRNVICKSELQRVIKNVHIVLRQKERAGKFTFNF